MNPIKLREQNRLYRDWESRPYLSEPEPLKKVVHSFLICPVMDSTRESSSLKKGEETGAGQGGQEEPETTV